MNILTIVRKQKGYSESEMLKAIGISLRTYRNYEKESHVMHEWLIRTVNNLENK
tara:strand:- start:10056 stop:10217 length:162 start_codon:yes stop_codon:yes gene_type:complete